MTKEMKKLYDDLKQSIADDLGRPDLASIDQKCALDTNADTQTHTQRRHTTHHTTTHGGDIGVVELGPGQVGGGAEVRPVVARARHAAVDPLGSVRAMSVCVSWGVMWVSTFCVLCVRMWCVP